MNRVESYQQRRTREFNQNIYEVALCIMVFKSYIIDTSILVTSLDVFDPLFKAGFVLCMVWKLMTQNYNWQKLVGLGVLGMMCVYTCPKVSNYYLIFSFFGIAAMQDVDLKQVLKKTSMLRMAIILFHVVIYFINLKTNPGSITYSYREDGVPRHFFYLGHANTFAGYVLWTSLEYIYANYEKVYIPKLLFVWGLNYLCYTYADSNTSFATATLIIFLFITDKMELHFYDKILYFISKYAFAVFSVVFSFLCAGYTKFSGPLMIIFQTMNKFFTGRLLFGAYVYDVYNFTPLGRTIYFAKKTQWRQYWFDTMVFDNAYVWMFVLGGAVYLIFISGAFIWMGKKTSKIAQIVILAYVLYGVTEAYIINAINCFPLLFVGVYLYQKQTKTQTGKEKIVEKHFHKRKNTVLPLGRVEV